MKGIILAGGSATRLYPATKSVSKQILPVYDKPMIYYPLSVLMLADIRDILIISTERDISDFKGLLGDGKELGLNISYAVQEKPKGIAEAFIIGKEFIGDDSVALILGDNLFCGNRLGELLEDAAKSVQNGAVVFGYHVSDPRDFGVVEFDERGKVISIEEKPKIPKSNYAVTGLYFYDNEVVSIAENIKPSARGELEITSINNEYLKRNKLNVTIMSRGFVWLDTGTHRNLLEAANYVQVIQSKQGLYIACIEEIAFRKNYISANELLRMGKNMDKTDYGRYLIKLANESLEVE